ncbi:MAG: hypothetical protein HFH07_04515 [Dorea sp.]|jgi:hypothetical protein|nr:hypothetical protein [Dorea sp.]
MKKNLVIFIILVTVVMISMFGCGAKRQMSGQGKPGQKNDAEAGDTALKIAECYREIYEQALKDGTLGDESVTVSMIECLGKAGYVAVDAENQINMVNADEAMEFIETAEKGNFQDDSGKEAGRHKLTIVCLEREGNFTQYDLRTEEGVFYVDSTWLVWNGTVPEIAERDHYEAYAWDYSKEGYLFFEEYRMDGFDGDSGHTAIRIQPLDAVCRELNKKYIVPVGYKENNLFLCDWQEGNFGELDFEDLFAALYPQVYGRSVPYTATDGWEIGKQYDIDREEYERVIQTFFGVDVEDLREKNVYLPEKQSYRFTPRGLYDIESPEVPYPEVTGYSRNEDGTLTCTVNAVFPYKNSSEVLTHEVTVRELEDGGFHYISNRVLNVNSEMVEAWHITS